MKKIHSLWKYMACAATLMLGMASCTEYDTPASVEAGVVTDSIISEVTRRVLWVNIDGAAGSVVKQEVEKGNLPTLKRMMANGKYAWKGLADSRRGMGAMEVNEEDPLTWASMLTGVSSYLHFIRDYSYTPDFSLQDDPIDEEVSYFPTVVQYLGKADDDLRVSCITPWRNLNRYVGDAHSTITTATDAETQTLLLEQLRQDDYRLTITAFKGVLEAGKQGGFTAENSAYTSALQAVDGHLEEMLAAISERENAYYDDWLIIVTSNHGGTAEGQYGGSTDSERDIFGLFYYPHYKEFEMKGEMIEAALFDKSVKGNVPDTMAFYALGNTSLSFEFNLRMLPRSNGKYNGNNWDKIVGKGQWGAFRQRSTVVIRTNSSPAIENPITGSNDALWHTYYMGFGDVSGKERPYQISYDGIRSVSVDTDGGMGLAADTTYFSVGTGWLPTDYYVASIRLWNEILDDATVEANAGVWQEIPESHTYRKNLIGEWVLSPDRLEQDSIIRNRIPGMPDMHFTAKPTFMKMANTLPSQLKQGNLVMENTLVAPQIMYWLCGASSIDARMEGYNFLSHYALEEQWRDYEEE